MKALPIIPCPKCQSNNTGRRGSSPKGKQKIFCKDCNKFRTVGAETVGRPRTGENVLTPSERQKKYMASLTDEQRKSLYEKRSELRRQRKAAAEEAEENGDENHTKKNP